MIKPLVRIAALRALLGAVVLASAAARVVAVAAEPIPVADFFRPPVVTSPVMSPSGQYVAATMAGGAEGRQRLAIVSLEDTSKSKVIAEFNDADIVAVRWVNDDRLVFALTDRQSPDSNQRSQGLFAVDREGLQPPRRLIKAYQSKITSVSNIADRELTWNHQFHSIVRDGSNDVVVRQYVFDNTGEPVKVQLWRLDTVTGRARLLTADAPEHALDWAIDRQGNPRVTLSSSGGKTRMYWKPEANSAWVAASETDTYGDEGPGIQPWAVGADDVLYATARFTDESGALVRVDMHGSAVKVDPLVRLKGYDFTGDLVFGAKGNLLGAHYLTDARSTQWFDPALKTVQERVDALLPGTINMIDCGACDQPAVVLVRSWSDRQPETVLLYNVKAATLTVLASSRPWIKPQTMATRDMIRFAARDGLSVPVHVTRPIGQKGPAPMVVLVHGGPWLRGGEWRWYAESQFLASRGYVVVEPEFRGSTGFGFKLYRAGWKQWGLGMQDDVADATEWAIKQGYADPRRTCIAGASYGGYATLMGLIHYPAMYRCGVEWVAVTDIDLIYSIHWGNFLGMYKEYGMPVLVGDQKKDAAQLASTSPLRLADKIAQPLFMAYGGIDQTVPIDHGSKMREALRRTNPNVEWIVYPDEGHGWMLQANNVDFWTRVERFLGRNLAADPVK